MDATEKKKKEPAIFNNIGNKIITEDREIRIIAKMDEPFIAVLGNVLSEEECGELISLSQNKLKRSKIGNTREVDDLRSSSSMFFDEGENELVSRIERRVSQIMGIPA